MKHITSISFESREEKVSSLLEGMYENTSYGETENGALTFIRSGSSLLDFYAQAGAMRGENGKALDLFKKAYAENPLYAIRILFYLRDIRGGQGERDLFRICSEYIGSTYPEVFEKIVKFIPEYGRWDDMFFDNEACIKLIKEQLEKDVISDEPSLLAKWLPTINASSKTTKAKARFFAKKFGYGEKEYRLKVRNIRRKLKVVEEKMSARKWGEIEYSKVPSQASRIYKNAFKKHDEKRYNKFIERAEKGEEKINAGTLYPYQIYKSVQKDYSRTLEALWNQLPDYTRGNDALVVADVSGSMEGDPMAVSVSLALYFAERNKGRFRNHFITFSENPRLQIIKGETLEQKMNSIERTEWSMNTNLQAVFDLILGTAIQNNLSQEDMPKTIYIISDMEFDEATSGDTNYREIEKKYRQYGFSKPNIVFWNVNASGKNLPVQKSEQGVALASGFSPVIFKIAVEGKTPEQVMMDTISSERYKRILL